MPFDVVVGTVTWTISDADVAALRRMIGATTYTDAQLAERIALDIGADGAVDLNATAASIWHEKAAEQAGLVDMSESGSTRKLSDLHKQALAMAAHYSSVSESALIGLGRPARTRAITRADG